VAAPMQAAARAAMIEAPNQLEGGMAVAGERIPVLPRGRRDLVRRAAIWLAFLASYETARGLARVPRAEAVQHGRDVISIERGLGAFVEPELQRRAIGAGRGLMEAADWTYRLAEFTVVTAVLVWTYLRRTERYVVLQNALLATNLLGYLGYVKRPHRTRPWRPSAGLPV